MHQMISRGHGGIAHGLCRARQGNERMHDGWEYRGRAAFRFPFWFSYSVVWEKTALLHCTALYCTAEHCSVLQSTVLYNIVSYSSVLCCC